ncbi:nucleolin 2 isoform X1 [Leguminivora glycinivorella]|uniref:nucleolin 2 isoform X1 n=1 Tax=Leguminivora glycinivorella TaxID=1035111 RepID=UPI00200D82DD|nr:nucleolin 2 isoform X1 [Leguminivora glycinivorella]XP_048001754.1 nucleolin 2 isoform X2 [Leguminivora glycinivorella]XP_048001755.1 nucleolin 2 isoform X3 [Leguminivora glycinivorella]XP_048001756.1 nucleolin 2 isoform X1 [Leguminivora glycinivorella]
MDYVVGNVAALIAGNVTPNRPKLSKRALTPIKHMPSPNVTPKSELVDDRSIFLSPSVQKKKAIVKKSPKRIFQNPDLDVTNENEGNTSTTSPKADKVKKHLKGELDATVSPKNNSKAAKTSEKQESPKKKAVNSDMNNSIGDNVNPNELTPKKNKKKRNSITENRSVTESVKTNQSEGTPKKNKKKRNSTSEVGQNVAESPKKNKTQNKENVQNDTATNKDAETVKSPKKKKKNKKKPQNTEVEKSENTVNNVNTAEGSEPNETEDIQPKETKATNPKKKNKKRKHQQTNENSEENDGKPTKTKKIKVNPNAITDKDSDSEHESDNEIESETEESNKEVLEKSAEPEEASSDEEDTPTPKKKEKVEEKETGKVREVNTEDEIKRTLFVGNVPFSKKCKKEIKKIFSKYGQIESVRIRTVPVKDPSVTPKLAVIKQELHPERSTVNVYVKFTNPQCVDQALAENNTVLNNNHLRVTRSGSTGAEHDPRHSVFVGNIPFALEDEGLREKFEKCGEIESVRIVRDKKTNAGKGFGYVNFTSKDGVELALALTDEDLTIKNRIMRVKRCTQVTQRQAQKGNNRPGFQGKKLSQGDRQRNQTPGKFNQGRNQGFQGNRGGNFQNRGGNFQNKSENFQNKGGNFQNKGGNFQNKGGNFQNKGGNFQGRGGNFGKQNDGEKVGAERRLMNKRKSQEGGDGPRDDQPREKKPRKEFVGMTAEKKKKRKFDKGQKKKKALSEILTK